MRYCISLIFSLLSGTLFGQLNDSDAFFNGSYDKTYILEHKIKQVYVTNDIDSNKTSFSIFDFDNNGFLIKQTILDKNLKNVNDYTFIYNNQGDQIERINVAYDVNRTDTVIFYKTYDGPLLIQETSSELPFLTKNIYNENKRKVQSITFLSKDTALSSKRVSFYSYDKNGKLKGIQETYIETNIVTPVSAGTTEFKYDESGNISVVMQSGKPDYILSYDKDGFLKSKTFKIKVDLGGLTIEEKYSYIFWK
ncbi:MAG: hypothetical protein RL582_402 [Bacteroidota bacterium]|jgi:hypothetical protein